MSENTEQKFVEQLVVVGKAVEWISHSGKSEMSLHKDSEAANQAAVRHRGIIHDVFIKRVVQDL